jgi:hypothetical protein
MSIKLIPVPLNGSGSNNNIDLDKQYIIEFRPLDSSISRYYGGRFIKQWFGWLFLGGPWNTGVELESKTVKAVWEIVVTDEGIPDDVEVDNEALHGMYLSS